MLYLFLPELYFFKDFVYYWKLYYLSGLSFPEIECCQCTLGILISISIFFTCPFAFHPMHIFFLTHFIIFFSLFTHLCIFSSSSNRRNSFIFLKIFFSYSFTSFPMWYYCHSIHNKDILCLTILLRKEECTPLKGNLREYRK